MIEIAILITAMLFGGMVLFSFGFAALVFSALPAEHAGAFIRKSFPYFYLFVIATSSIAAFIFWMVDSMFSMNLMLLISLTAIFSRQVLMPSINNATDNNLKTRFKVLHSFSVAITLLHIAISGYVIIQLYSS